MTTRAAAEALLFDVIQMDHVNTKISNDVSETEPANVSNWTQKGAYQPGGRLCKWLVPVDTLAAIWECPVWLLTDLPEVA